MDASGPQHYINNEKEVAPTMMPPEAAASSHHYSPPGNYAYGAQEAAKPEKKILGLRVVTFVLSVALVVVIIIAAVGAGVGASQAVQSARDDARTSAAAAVEAAQSTCSGAPSVVTITETATVTTSGSPSSATETSSTISVPREGEVALDCPNLNGTTQSISIDDERWMFDASCSRDIQGRGLNIMSVVAYHFEDCLVACASHNLLSNADDCVGVAFNRKLQVVEKQNGNCWLKNGTGSLRSWSSSSRDNTYIAARLVGRGS